MRRTITLSLVVLALLVVGLLSSIFVVDERQRALVLQFGQIRQVREEPGLGLKIPFIQDVVYYDDRILSLDTESIEVTPSDDRRLVVDAFARYRITDIVQFREAVGAGGVATAQDRLAGILNDQIRAVLGADQVTSDTILSADRRLLMNRIRDGARAQAASLGLDVVDVRLKTTNLPAQNLDATFARMRAEREREAADEIARGNEAAQRVRAQADRTVTETLSAAERDGQITQGEADAEANRIFADAYGADPEFFSFYRSMQAYVTALQGDTSTLVMTPANDFLNYLYSDSPEGAEVEPTTAPAAEPGPGLPEPAEEAAAGDAADDDDAPEVPVLPEPEEEAAAEPLADPLAEPVAAP